MRPVQSADDGGLDESACPVVKNIGKPCAGKPHARFDEGGQENSCSLLYLKVFLTLKVFPKGFPRQTESFNSDNELEGNRSGRREPGIRVDVLGLSDGTKCRG